MAKNDGEPTSAPQPERWYELKLGSSFNDRPSSKFCTLRYEFKPASIDKSQRGTLHKNKDNRVTVEFNNNQPGKPKVAFEGTNEDYKDNDGVMFFDGQSFRLERLHRAVKRLRHVRLPGESAAAVNITPAVTNAPAVESRSPPLVKTMKPQILNKPTHPAMCLEVEKIDIGNAESSGSKHAKRSSDMMQHPTLPNNFSASPAAKSHGPDDDNVDILEEADDQDHHSPPKPDHLGLDMNLPHPNNDDTDDEIADVDASDDESNKGPNAAEALRAQVTAAEEGHPHAREQGDETSSSSGSGSSGSGSASGTSSSSDSDDSDRADSASSGGDVDI